MSYLSMQDIGSPTSKKKGSRKLGEWIEVALLLQGGIPPSLCARD
jgi:hypothetical protein